MWSNSDWIVANVEKLTEEQNLERNELIGRPVIPVCFKEGERGIYMIKFDDDYTILGFPWHRLVTSNVKSITDDKIDTLIIETENTKYTFKRT